MCERRVRVELRWKGEELDIISSCKVKRSKAHPLQRSGYYGTGAEAETVARERYSVDM
jgi:hypothetical protein